MAKKSFKDQDNPALAYIKATHEEQDVQEPQEIRTVQKTQGRKGQKLPRINMAFSQDNLEYLQIISSMEGISMTEYVNRLIAVDREERKDIIEKAKALLTEAKK